MVMVLGIVLAGCATPEVPDPVEGPVATQDLGIVRGVVVNEQIVPISDASILFANGTMAATSDLDGRFTVGPIAPGFHTLRIQVKGYHALEKGVTVQAGIQEPSIVTFSLSADPASIPHFQLFEWTGFIQCGFGTPVPGYSPMACNVIAGAANEEVQSLPRLPSFVQTELTWRSTQQLNNELRVIHRGPGGEYAGNTGADPVILRVEGDALVLGDELELITNVFPTNDAPDVVFDQQFSVFTTVFYQFTPPEDWSFIVDGEPEVPA